MSPKDLRALIMSEVKLAKKSINEAGKRSPAGNEMLANEIYELVLECAEAKFKNSYNGDGACEAAARELADTVDSVVRSSITQIFTNLLEGQYDLDKKDYFNPL